MSELLQQIPVPETYYTDASSAFDLSFQQAREQKNNPSRRLLSEEIQHLRVHWAEEGLPANWVDLPDFPFLIHNQIGFLTSETFGKGLTPQQKKELWIETTEFSLRGWMREYLQNALVFPGQLTMEQQHGEWKLIDARHGARMDLADTLSKKERDGAVWSAYNETAKQFLVNAPDESIVVITSTAGKSGIPDNQGKEIEYEDSHVDLLQKRGAEIIEYTIRTDFTNQEHREAISRLFQLSGQKMLELTESSSPADYLRCAALFDSRKTPITMHEIVRVLEQTRYDRTGSKKAYKNKGWEEIYTDVGKSDELWRGNTQSERYIQNFVEYARNNSSLKEALATTILLLSRYWMEQRSHTVAGAFSVSAAQSAAGVSPVKLGSVFEEVQTIGGCAGGGKKQNSAGVWNSADAIISKLTGENVLDDEEEDDYGSRTFIHEIDGCNWKNRRPYNEKIHRCQNSRCPDPESVAC